MTKPMRDYNVEVNYRTAGGTPRGTRVRVTAAGPDDAWTKAVARVRQSSRGCTIDEGQAEEVVRLFKTDEATTCPKCGTETTIIEAAEGVEEHRCPRCGFAFETVDIESGWALFNDGTEIQRDDSNAVFDTDQEAWAYVLRRARHGSHAHLKALIVLRANATALYWARVSAEDMGPHPLDADNALVTALLALPAGGHDHNPPLLAQSPEDTHVWACTRCTNTTHFIGVDDRGWGGPDACQGDCGFDPDKDISNENFCHCDTVLTQPFSITAQDGTRDGERTEHEIYTGGEYDSEIGTYTRIYCAACNVLLWLDPTLPVNTRILILDEAEDAADSWING